MKASWLCACVLSRSVMSDSLRPCGLLQARILEWVAIPPSPGDLPKPGIEPRSPASQADSLPAELPGKPSHWMCWNVEKNASAFICISDEWMNEIQIQNHIQDFTIPIKHVFPSLSQQLSYCSGILAYLSAQLWAPQGHVLFIFSVWLNTSYVLSY